MNCSDDLIRRVEGDHYEEAVKKFEIIRVVIKGTFTPLVGMTLFRSIEFDSFQAS